MTVRLGLLFLYETSKLRSRRSTSRYLIQAENLPCASVKENVFKLHTSWSIDDNFLNPEIQDDPLLYAFDEISEQDEPVHSISTPAATSNTVDGPIITLLHLELQKAKAETKDAEARLESYKNMVEETFMSDSIKKMGIDDPEIKVGDADHNDYYFNSYAGTEIHESMLRV